MWTQGTEPRTALTQRPLISSHQRQPPVPREPSVFPTGNCHQQHHKVGSSKTRDSCLGHALRSFSSAPVPQSKMPGRAPPTRHSTVRGPLPGAHCWPGRAVGAESHQARDRVGGGHTVCATCGKHITTDLQFLKGYGETHSDPTAGKTCPAPPHASVSPSVSALSPLLQLH